MDARREFEDVIQLGDEVEAALGTIKDAEDALARIVQDADERQTAARDAARDDSNDPEKKEKLKAANEEYDRAETVSEAFDDVKSSLGILQRALEERRVAASDALYATLRSSPPSDSARTPVGQESAGRRRRQPARPQR